MHGQTASYAYDYDSESQLLSESRGAESFSYENDATGQLIRASSTSSDESFSYDVHGNRSGYTIGAGNRTLSDGTNSYTYDAEGNRIEMRNVASGEATRYGYDHRNRMTDAVTVDADGNLISDVRFLYDALDRRIGKIVDGVAEYQAYDRDDVWADLDGQGQTKSRYLYGSGVDQILARQRAGEGASWYLTDHFGNGSRRHR